MLSMPALMIRTSAATDNMRHPLSTHIAAYSGLTGTTPQGFLWRAQAAEILSIAAKHFAFG